MKIKCWTNLYRLVILPVTLVFISSSPAFAEPLTVGVLTNSGAQRAFYTSFAQEFESRNPDIQVKLVFQPDDEFKESLMAWFQNGNGPELLNWQGGERLFQYVREGYIADISSVWQQNNLEGTFSPGAVGGVSVDGRRYGVPISYYQWGFYYRKSLFDKLGLRPPSDWQEFLNVCQQLKNNGVVPVTVGAKFKWPTAAWFDYLNLRINGLEFHQQLLKGEMSFNDERVSNVLSHWKELLDKGYFVSQYDRWKWSEAMPFLYHKLAGMTLMGNFFAGTMPPAIKDDFRFFRFPIIDNNVEIYEEAPMDIFMIPSYAKDNTSARRFIVELAGKQFQERFNQMLGTISPNIQSADSSDYFIQQGTLTLGEAQGVSQFFDRDTNAAMATAAMDIFTRFMGNKNIAQAQAELEAARQQHLL